MADAEDRIQQSLENGIMLAYKMMAQVFEVEAIRESAAERASESTPKQLAIQQENFKNAQMKSLKAVVAILGLLNACSYNGTARIIVDG